jgi:hypothetical protein
MTHWMRLGYLCSSTWEVRVNVFTTEGLCCISINDSSSSYLPSSKSYCNLCSCNLTLLNPQKRSGGVLAVMYHTSQTKERKSSERTSLGHPNQWQIIALISQVIKSPWYRYLDDKELSSTYGKQKLPKSCKGYLGIICYIFWCVNYQ